MSNGYFHHGGAAGRGDVWVLNILTMAGPERANDIAILKRFGMPRTDVRYRRRR